MLFDLSSFDVWPLLLLLPFVIGAVTTDMTENLKYMYAQDRMNYIASQEVVLWNIISKKKDPVGGRGQWILPVQTRNVGVFRGHAEGGALTTTRAQPSTTEATFSLQEFHGIYDASWKLLQDAARSEWAFEKIGDFLEKSMRRRVFRLLNAELLGTGRGELGVMSAADDQAQITVRALPLVDEGMVVDVIDASDDDAKISNSATVTAIDVQNRAITLSVAASGSAAGDYVTIEDSVNSAGGSLHMLGVLAWISADNPASVVGNIGGLDRTTAGNDFWKGNVLTNGGNGNRPLTEDVLLQGQDLIRERGGEEVTDYVSNLPILRRYHEILRAETIASLGQVGTVGGGLGRGDMPSGKKGEGETPYKFSNTPWRAEPFFDANTMIAFNRKNFLIGHGENMLPAPIGEIFDGQVSFFKRTSNATFEVDHYWQAELLCDNPAATVRWTEVAEA